jgi:cell division transport system ATP-binding protein
MNVLSRINASGTTVLMATHDAGIVNQMQRRVVEISQGRIVRDETEGGYQTSSIPLGEADTAPISVVSESQMAEPTPLRAKLDLSIDPDEIPEQFPWELRA